MPDFPHTAIKGGKTNPHAVTLTALTGAEFYPVKQNLHGCIKAPQIIPPFQLPRAQNTQELSAKNGKKSWHCLTQSQVGPVLRASQFPVEQVCIGLQTAC